jgi:hypothetical protein
MCVGLASIASAPSDSKMRTYVRALASLPQLRRLVRAAALGARRPSERSACCSLPVVREVVRPERSDHADRRATGRRRNRTEASLSSGGRLGVVSEIDPEETLPGSVKLVAAGALTGVMVAAHTHIDLDAEEHTDHDERGLQGLARRDANR